MKNNLPTFRASGLGNLAIIPRGEGITENQLKSLNELLKKKVEKGLTEIQGRTLDELIKKRDTPPGLSEAAKRWVEEMWLFDKKGYRHEFDSKYTSKGLQAEEDSISLISDVYGRPLFKNPERVTVRVGNANISGEADIVEGQDQVHDTKTSWSPVTFMKGEMTDLYEWQLRAYIWLYGATKANLHYCLVDCPPDVYQQEYSRFCFRNGILDDTMEEYEDDIAQFERNLIYTTNPAYSKEERVKTFTIYHDQDKWEWMLGRIEMAAKYYESITLNQR